MILYMHSGSRVLVNFGSVEWEVLYAHEACVCACVCVCVCVCMCARVCPISGSGDEASALSCLHKTPPNRSPGNSREDCVVLLPRASISLRCRVRKVAFYFLRFKKTTHQETKKKPSGMRSQDGKTEEIKKNKNKKSKAAAPWWCGG
jgi:hypothetical protein